MKTSGVAKAKIERFAEKVAPIYRLLDWRWGRQGAPPSKEAIVEQLHGLLDHLFEEEPKEGESVGTGGLEVGVDEGESLYLMFRVKDYLLETNFLKKYIVYTPPYSRSKDGYSDYGSDAVEVYATNASRAKGKALRELRQMYSEPIRDCDGDRKNPFAILAVERLDE